MGNFTLRECVILSEYGLKATINNGELIGFVREPEKENIRQRIKNGIKSVIAELCPVCKF